VCGDRNQQHSSGRFQPDDFLFGRIERWEASDRFHGGHLGTLTCQQIGPLHRLSLPVEEKNAGQHLRRLIGERRSGPSQHRCQCYGERRRYGQQPNPNRKPLGAFHVMDQLDIRDSQSE
jgi:hypothetical protein